MRRALIAIVKTYRLLASPWLGAGCRFGPTCSVYAIAALEQHGSLQGAGLSAWRIVRCGPWCQGGHDPVPTQSPATRLFSRLIPSRAGLKPSAPTRLPSNAP